MIPAKYWSPTKKLMLLGAMAGGKAVEDTATGNPLTFLTDLAKPLKSLLIPFTPIQEGSGDPSPSNIRPIVPWDGLSVEHGGKNLLNTSVKHVYSVTTIGVGSYYGRYETKLKAGTYTFSVEFLNGEHYGAYIRKKNGSQIDLWTASNVSVNEKTFTLTQDGEYNIWLYRSQAAGGVDVDSIGEFQLEVGSSATAYEPYKPITETDISFPSPVYGGTLDVVSGVLTVEWVLRSMKAMRWGNFASYRLFVASELKDKVTMSLCDCFPVVRGNPSVDQTLGAYDNGAAYAGSILFYKDGMTSDQDFKDWLDSLEYDPYIAYKVETPQTIQLTGEQITALVGNNTIWSDANGQMAAVFFKKG